MTDDKFLRKINVLDHGFVELVDYMGSDKAIEQAARVSYTGAREEERSEAKTRGLIRYLMRQRHTTPFEMVEFKFAVKVPIFVWRQWIRHRTASVNEISGRYAQLPDNFYLPEEERLQKQSQSSKQGSALETVDDPTAYRLAMDTEQRQAYVAYEQYLDADMAREVARVNLPLSIYTEAYWKMDLHNLFHFLALRLDPHAQWEIRQYAEAIKELIQPIVPMAWAAFDDYVLNSLKLSFDEQCVIVRMIGDLEDPFERACEVVGLSKREQRELVPKLHRLGIDVDEDE